MDSGSRENQKLIIYRSMKPDILLEHAIFSIIFYFWCYSDKWNPSCIQGAFCGHLVVTCHGGSIYCGISKPSQDLPAFPTPYGRLRMALHAFPIHTSIVAFTWFNHQEESSRAVIRVLQGRDRQMATSHASLGSSITPAIHNRNASHFSQVAEWRIIFNWPQRPSLSHDNSKWLLFSHLSLKTK